MAKLRQALHLALALIPYLHSLLSCSRQQGTAGLITTFRNKDEPMLKGTTRDY